MKRMALVGLLALAACAAGEDSEDVSAARECPDVSAGSIPSESPVVPLAQHVWSSTSQPLQEDGRQSFIIRFRSGLVSAKAARAQSVERTGGQVFRTFHSVPAVAARLSAAERAALASDPNVEAIEPDIEWQALGTSVPQATNIPQSVGSPDEYTEGLRMVQAPSVWDADNDGQFDVGAPNGEGIKVCVIDSGIDPGHPELKSRIVNSHDFVDDDDDASDCAQDASGKCKVWGEGHGTHVAGTIAAQLGSAGLTDPGMSPGGVAGVAPGAQLLIARVLNLEGRAKLSAVMAAVDWCQQQGARIASLSLGGGEWGDTARQQFQKVNDDGMLVVAAAGNDSGPLLYPAAFPSVLAVGAVDAQANLADFSCRGDNLGLVAPGVDVLSTFPEGNGTYADMDVSGKHFDARSAVFVPAADVSGALVDCDYGNTRGSCAGGTCGGFVAYVRLGGGKLESVVANVMRQGARAVVLAHPKDGGEAETLVFTPGRWVPGAMVSHSTGEALLKQKGTVNMRVRSMDYARFSGTSMAAPHVSGVAALVWSARPSLTPNQVRDVLQRTARDLGPGGYDKQYGYGLVQAKAALDALSSVP